MGAVRKMASIQSVPVPNDSGSEKAGFKEYSDPALVRISLCKAAYCDAFSMSYVFAVCCMP